MKPNEKDTVRLKEMILRYEERNRVEEGEKTFNS